ncbi:MAG TPA: hypothetical protein GX708_20690 [Gallicola sp.]|nr:hypothetical protein [Gallicola sp.]
MIPSTTTVSLIKLGDDKNVNSKVYVEIYIDGYAMVPNDNTLYDVNVADTIEYTKPLVYNTDKHIDSILITEILYGDVVAPKINLGKTTLKIYNIFNEIEITKLLTKDDAHLDIEIIPGVNDNKTTYKYLVKFPDKYY